MTLTDREMLQFLQRPSILGPAIATMLGANGRELRECILTGTPLSRLPQRRLELIYRALLSVYRADKSALERSRPHVITTLSQDGPDDDLMTAIGQLLREFRKEILPEASWWRKLLVWYLLRQPRAHPLVSASAGQAA